MHHAPPPRTTHGPATFCTLTSTAQHLPAAMALPWRMVSCITVNGPALTVLARWQDLFIAYQLHSDRTTVRSQHRRLVQSLCGIAPCAHRKNRRRCAMVVGTRIVGNLVCTVWRLLGLAAVRQFLKHIIDEQWYSLNPTCRLRKFRRDFLEIRQRRSKSLPWSSSGSSTICRPRTATVALQPSAAPLRARRRCRQDQAPAAGRSNGAVRCLRVRGGGGVLFGRPGQPVRRLRPRRALRERHERPARPRALAGGFAHPRRFPTPAYGRHSAALSFAMRGAEA